MEDLEILEDNLLCCFCDEVVESDRVNHCELIVKSNWDKPWCEQGDQVFFTHSKCSINFSGKVSKSFLILTFPAQSPGILFFWLGFNVINLATGVPTLQIITSSP